MTRVRYRPAIRMQDIQPFHVMDILARARALEAGGRSVVHMEIGEPDFPTPEPVIEGGRRALLEGRTHYTPAVGLTSLREAISGFYQSRFGVNVDPERIVVTPGASGALQLVMAVLVNPGEQVLLPDPGYPCNRHFVRLVEGEPVLVPVDAENRYQITAGRVDQLWGDRTRVVMVASPSNPTGTLDSRDGLTRLLEVVQRRGGDVVVDEIYQGLVYDRTPETILSETSDVFVVNSFSKYFGMTGWRLGWLVVPRQYVRDIDKLAQNIFLSPPAPAQYAAHRAFAPENLEILEQRRAIFKERRDFLLPALRELGFDVPVDPQGAFYIYASCTRFTDDSHRFSRELLDQAGVAITPGVDFGDNAANTHVRFAYTTSVEDLEIGVERIRQFLSRC